MDHGFPLLVDGKTAALSSLHQFLSLIGPCRIDDSLLHISHRCSHSHYIAVKASYKEQEFRLIVTIIGQPKQAKDFQSIAFNTAIIVQVLKFLKVLTESAGFVHSCASFMLFLLGFGLVSFIFSGTLRMITLISYCKTPPLWATRPCFAIILQSNDEIRIFSVSVTPKKMLHIPIPSMNIENSRLKVTFRTLVQFEISINSEALEANISEAKVSVRREVLLPSLQDVISRFTEMIVKFLNSKQKTRINMRTGKHSKSKSPPSYSSRINSMFQSDYTVDIFGSMLQIKLNGDILNSSIYFKLKKLTETIGEKKNESNSLNNGGKNCSHVSNLFFSIEFSEILLSSSQNIPSCATKKVSFLYSQIATNKVFYENSFHEINRIDVDCPKYSHLLSDIKIELNCCQIQLLLDFNDENNKVIISNLSSSYTYSDFLVRDSTHNNIDLRSTEVSHENNSANNESFRRKNWNILVGSLNPNITEKFIDFILDKKSIKCLHYLCFFVGKIIINLIDSSYIQLNIEDFIIQLIHSNDDILIDNKIKNRNNRKYEKINNKMKLKEITCQDSNHLDFNFGSNIDDQMDVQGTNVLIPVSTESTVYASTIFFQKISYKISNNLIDFNIKSYDIYFGELLSANIYEMISISDTRNEGDLISLWSPD